MNKSALAPAFVLVGLAILLSGCSESEATTSAPQKRETQVSVITLTPKTLPVTSELAGRTVAVNAAEVRPQVTGTIQAREFVEGTNVKAGDILYKIDPATYQAAYDSAAATLARANAAQRNAETKTERLKKLSDARAVSSQDYEDAMLALGQAKADVASANAAIESAKINLDRTNVRAAISGRIDRSTVNIGALVTAEQTTALTTIRQLDPIYVEVSQPSEKLLEFRRATSDGSLTPAKEPVVHLTLEDGSAYAHAGKLQFAEASINETSGTVIVRAIFPNPEQMLLPGMYARASIEEGTAKDSYLLPQRAISRKASGEAVAKVVASDGKVAERTVKVERSSGQNWIVSAGLKDGDRLIVEGGQKARAGDQVKATNVTINDTTGEIKPVEAAAASTKGQQTVELSQR